MTGRSPTFSVFAKAALPDIDLTNADMTPVGNELLELLHSNKQLSDSDIALMTTFISDFDSNLGSAEMVAGIATGMGIDVKHQIPCANVAAYPTEKELYNKIRYILTYAHYLDGLSISDIIYWTPDEFANFMATYSYTTQVAQFIYANRLLATVQIKKASKHIKPRQEQTLMTGSNEIGIMRRRSRSIII